MRTLISVLLFVFSIHATAGDASEFRNLGFSTDGKYYAFVQYGTYDGWGAGYAKIDVIDVASNNLIKRVLVNDEDMVDDPTMTQEEIIQKAMTEAKLSSQYGISGSNMGNTLISRPNTDFSNYLNTVFSREYWAQGGASTTVLTYKLDLKEVPAPVEAGNNDWCWTDSNMIELSMSWDDNYDGVFETQTLQKDTRQPKSRACSYAYSVQYVVADKDGVAVALRYQGPGFEGPDYRYIVVTGKFKN